MRNSLRTAGLLAGIAAICVAGIALGADQPAPRLAGGTPDFSSHDMGWAADGIEFLPVPGESVGRYEGDELVIDTIGLSDKTFLDFYHTPHTEKLHVVERYKLLDGGKRMQGIAEIEDPGAFTANWKAMHYYIRHNTPISESESICAENNSANYFHEDQWPIPQSDAPDF